MACSIAAPKRQVLSLPFLLPSWSDSTALVLRRYQSSYRRTKQRLRVKPDASFGPSTEQTGDHIIFNPPSSAPTTYHTPTKFLPPNDVRRRLRAESPLESSNTEKHDLPLIFKNSTGEKNVLNENDIAEIRKLRAQDPMTWSRYKLAKQFNCNPLFVAMVCETSPEKKEIQKQILEAVKSRWGPKRTIAREDRELRKERWQRDL